MFKVEFKCWLLANDKRKSKRKFHVRFELFGHRSAIDRINIYATRSVIHVTDHFEFGYTSGDDRQNILLLGICYACERTRPYSNANADNHKHGQKVVRMCTLYNVHKLRRV